MPRSCCSSDVDGASVSYPPSGSGWRDRAAGYCIDLFPHAWYKKKGARVVAVWPGLVGVFVRISRAIFSATTADVIGSQVSALTTGTTLVSITIGGNDAGFSSVMETCVLRSTSSCLNAVATAEAFVTTQLPARLTSTLQAIRQHAPNARIVLLGYPDLYDLSKSSTCIGLSTSDRIALNAGADALDSALSAAAQGSQNTVFADVRGQFAGHEICDSGSWLHSMDLLAISSSYHPTASGQILGYEPVFSENT